MLTEETIQSISPSPKNFSDGKALQKDLFETGKKEHLFWGKCQGSGANPYLVMFNVNSLSYKCSCPVGNRGTICKHVLGLMIKSVNSAESFADSEPPAWAEAWVKKQLDKKEKVEQIANSTQTDEKVKIGLERIREGKSKTTKNREKQMSEGIDLLNSYLNDILNEGTLIASTWSSERKDVLIESLNSAKMPALAYMIEENLDSNPAETIAKSAVLSNLWQKRDTLSVEVQEFLLGALGSYIKKEEVIQLKDVVKDTWLCVAYYNEYRYKPSRMTLHHWFLVGKNTGQWTRIMHTEVYAAYGNSDPKPNIQIGKVYEGSIAYFPASQRGILLQDWQIGKEQNNFILQKEIVPHYQEKTITELPLFFTLKSCKETYIQKIDADTYRILIENNVYECKDNLQSLWIAQGEKGLTLIYAQTYPHKIMVLGGILENGIFIPNSIDIERNMDSQYAIPDVLKKRLEVGKKMGDIQLEGLNNKDLQPVQQWARTFLWYNYGKENKYIFEKPAFLTEKTSNPVPDTFFKEWLRGIKIDKAFLEKGLSILQERKYTLSPYMLSKITEDLSSVDIQRYKETLGSRAKYLLNLEEKQHDDAYYIKLFEEGNTEERKKAHKYLLKNNPKVLKDLIKQVYKKDKAELRKYWLQSDEVILFDGHDEEWIVEQLKNEKSYDVKTDWIWRLGDSFLDTNYKPFQLSQKWINAIDKYIVFETHKKGIKAKITLPEEKDFEYFAEMGTWKGIHGDKAGVLMFLLSCKPVHTWNYSIEELAKAVKGNNNEEVFWDGLILACYRYSKDTPQKLIDELYHKGKYSNYWKHLLYPLLSTQMCIEQGLMQKNIETSFFNELIKREDITHAHLGDILQALEKNTYKNYRIEQFSPNFIHLFVKNSAKENLQFYIDALAKCTENMEVVTPLSEAIKCLKEMYSNLV